MSKLPVGLRRVLVTGASSGIGHAVVAALLERGAKVAGVARRSALIDGRAVALACDLADPAARKGLVERARAALGGLDGLVYAAGVVAHQLPGAIDEASLRAQLEVDLVAPLRLGEEALPLLDEGGAMVFVTSTLAERPIVTSAVYSAAKAGLTAVTRSFALAGAARGLRINDVSPGVIDTAMVRERGPAELERLRRLHPLGRLGTAAEVAAAILHLLAAPFTTGSTLRVDGGLLARE